MKANLSQAISVVDKITRFKRDSKTKATYNNIK